MALSSVLTERQAEILKAIIEEHISTAQPIASVDLVVRRSLPVSGATVRNIMADLVRSGYLRMLHVSSGRTPTDRAYRYYVNDLMDEDSISLVQEMAVKQKLMQSQMEIYRLMKGAVDSLSELTDYLSFGLTSDGFKYSTGASNILDIPEFFEIDVTKSVFKLIDDYELMKSILDDTSIGESGGTVKVLIGREIGLANLEPVCLIFGKSYIGDKVCYAGVIAPARTQYSKDIPLVRHIAQLLNEVGENI